MKRDLDFMRKIMLYLEDRTYIMDNISSLWPNKELAEYEKISYHVVLLGDLGYLKLEGTLLGKGFPDYYINRITNDGHVYLDLVRDEGTWGKVKTYLLKNALQISLTALQIAAANIR